VRIPESDVRWLSPDPHGSDVMPRFAHCTYDAQGVRDRLLEMADSVVNDAPVLEQESRLVRFYGELVNTCSVSAAPPPSGREPSRSVRLARDFLHSMPDRDVRLAEVAAAAGITACHLAHVYTRAMGVSVHAYHLLVRIRHARQLLATGLNAGEAGAAVGFADQSHFTRHFKRIVGVPPGSYARGLKVMVSIKKT
jgi:AraC-like DNA-binding protein